MDSLRLGRRTLSDLLRLAHSKRMSASALITTTPNMRCVITLLAPLTLSVRPPWLSLRLEFTRSALLRALYWRARSGSIGAEAVPQRLFASIMGTLPWAWLWALIAAAS